MNKSSILKKLKKIIIDKILGKVDEKIKKRELLSLKTELALRHKTINDYSDSEIAIILADKREKIIAKIKDKSLIGLLITLLIGI